MKEHTEASQIQRCHRKGYDTAACDYHGLLFLLYIHIYIVAYM